MFVEWWYEYTYTTLWIDGGDKYYLFITHTITIAKTFYVLLIFYKLTYFDSLTLFGYKCLRAWYFKNVDF